MKIALQSEMSRIDLEGARILNIPMRSLMDRAGKMIAHTVANELSVKKTEKILILCGPGNNGGDGIAAGIQLHQMGFQKCRLVLTKNPDKLNPDPAWFYSRIRGIPVLPAWQDDGVPDVLKEINQADWIIDALFGTGLSRSLKGRYAFLIQAACSVRAKIISIDLPSGLYADSPELPSVHIRSHYTVAVGLPKISHVLLPSREEQGRLMIRNIGFPSELLKDESMRLNWYTKEKAVLDLPERPSGGFKNWFGHLAVWAGGEGHTGAACLACRAACHVGAGLVTLLTPKELNLLYEIKLTEVMTRILDMKDQAACLKFLEDKPVLLCGPGLDDSPDVFGMFKEILTHYPGFFVLDAQAINFLARAPELLQLIKGRAVLTPHLGEFSRLTGQTAGKMDLSLIRVAGDFAQAYSVHIILKSSDTVTVSPEQKNIWINSSGNPGLARAGSGDLLSGVVASLLAQEISVSVRLNKSPDPAAAVRLAPWLHGRAADEALKADHIRSLSLESVLFSFSDVFNSLKEETV